MLLTSAETQNYLNIKADFGVDIRRTAVVYFKVYSPHICDFSHVLVRRSVRSLLDMCCRHTRQIHQESLSTSGCFWPEGPLLLKH